MIVAGEASGDRHAANLVEALRAAEPSVSLEFFGAAGPEMRSAGVEAVVESDELSVVGVLEIARAMRVFVKAFRALRSAAVTRRPDVAILVDFPEFNLKLAKSLKKQGIRVVYYISPQIWAWRKYRAATIRKHVDLLLTILPFEKEWYRERGIENVEFVGSPLAKEVSPSLSYDQLIQKYHPDKTSRLIALLPGSRHKEIVRILPVMLKGAEKIAAAKVNAQFVVALGDGRYLSDVNGILGDIGSRIDVKVAVGETYDVLAASDVAIVTSGTATLEAGIIGTPMMIVYKTSRLNYVLLKPLISVEHFGLINLIAGRRVARELIQRECDAESLCEEALRLLDPETNSAVRLELAEAAGKLGEGGASLRAANAVIGLLDKHF